MSVCCECCVLSGRGLEHSSRGVLLTVARRCVWSRNLKHEKAKARYRAVKIQSQWVVTPGKQTKNKQTNKQHYNSNLLLDIPKCLQIHEINILYKSNTTFILCCYIHLGDMFRLIFSHLQAAF
jgi:hypothetical protein